MSKRYFILVTVAYAVGCAVGLAMFQSPEFSKSYLAKHGAEHKRYIETIKSDVFKAHEERPAVIKLPEADEENLKFVEEYVASDEFKQEEHRAWWFVEYFKVVNSTVFLLYLWGLAGPPLTALLDAQIEGVRKRFAEVEQEMAQAAKVKADAVSKTSDWEQVEAAIRKESEDTIAESMAKVKEEDESARKMLEKQLDDRKHAELLATAETIRLELVTAAIDEATEHYRTERLGEKLEINVNSFIKLLERMS